MGLILVRYGEVALKGGNRSMFIKRLRYNIRDCLKKHGLGGEVRSVRGRIMVETDDVDAAVEGIRKVFGVVSLSPVAEVPSSMEPIREEALRIAREMNLNDTVTFRVRARRADKTFPLISPEINKEVGAYIVEKTNACVDLRKPQITIGIEVRREGTYVYGKIIPAPGGLPLGIEGRVVALVSGGIDSPVAAWMMMKRGCGVVPLHFRQNDAGAAKTLENCEILSDYSYGWDIRPIVLEHADVFGDTYLRLREIGAERWTCVFCKRALMLKAAEIAEEIGASALVMGDSMGQVASQTLHNLEVVSYGIPKPILRPLIGFDKTEIVALAKRIGTFEASVRYADRCPFLPARPLTQGTVPKLLAIMRRLEELDSDFRSFESSGDSACATGHGARNAEDERGEKTAEV